MPDGPVGQGGYTVQAGDCIESIAYAHGFPWRTLWDLPGNAALKRYRSPNVLLPGDQVEIPDVRLRQESRPTEQRHRFHLLVPSCRFRLRFLDDRQRPRAGLAYVLTIDDKTTNGSLDGDGGLDVPIPANAATGTIQLQTDPDPEVYPLDLGHLDPPSAATGIRARLNNLGFTCASDGDWDADLQRAMRRFQRSRDLPTTDQLDAATRQALTDGHLS